MQRLIFKIILACCVLYTGGLSAQKVLVHENPDTTGKIPVFGRNRLLYAHPLVKIGVFAPIYEKGGRTNLLSTSVSGELRGKFKICKWNALTLDVGYRCDRWLINQDDTSYLPTYTGSRHKRERLSTQNITFAFCDRINFDRRGNILGLYVDLGVYGDYAFRAAHVYSDEYYDSNSPVATHVKTRVKLTHLQYINRFNYGLTARIGWEWASVFAMYRVTDLIIDQPQTDYPDMPRLVIGIEMYGILE